jgi:hypothetical protein
MTLFYCPHLGEQVELTEETERHWIVTAYIARKLAEGDVEWQRN